MNLQNKKSCNSEVCFFLFKQGVEKGRAATISPQYLLCGVRSIPAFLPNCKEMLA